MDEHEFPTAFPIRRLPGLLYICAALEAWRIAAFTLPCGRGDSTTGVIIGLSALLAAVFIGFCLTLASASRTVASGEMELSSHARRLKVIAYAALAGYALSWAFGWLWVSSHLGAKSASQSIFLQALPRLPLMAALLLLIDFLEKAQTLRRASEGTV